MLYLLEVMCCVVVFENRKLLLLIILVFVVCYSILMKYKYFNLLVFYRFVSVIVVEGGLNDRVSFKMNVILNYY